MRPFHHRIHKLSILSILCLIIYGFSGCGTIGPKSISVGRSDYNEAINKTENEQMLMSIIIGRYGETFSLLSVSGVAANIRFAANAGVQVGIGPTENYLGNIVPLVGSFAYEENPTITYSPVQGEQYFRQLMSPIPLDILVLFVRSGMASSKALVLLANRINDMQNPDFLKTPTNAHDIRFERFAELNAELYQEGVLQWVEHPREDVPFAILISGYSHQYLEKVSEYLGLLGFPMPTDLSKDIVLPVYFGAKGRSADGVAVSTRSTVDLIHLLRAAIEVPQEHTDKALTLNYPKPGPAGQGIRIHASKERPDNAGVAVKYRGYWFYVAEDDLRTKAFYMMVRTLWSVSIAAGADQRAAPVLTIPVSR